MNLSVNGDPYTAVTDEINAAYFSNNVVVVASAGNAYGGEVQYPATLSSVIAVSSVDQSNSFASFSAQGAKIELTAPGHYNNR
jgi:subtilisin family serine protease